MSQRCRKTRVNERRAMNRFASAAVTNGRLAFFECLPIAHLHEPEHSLDHLEQAVFRS
jgi:hypothetical protein